MNNKFKNNRMYGKGFNDGYQKGIDDCEIDLNDFKSKLQDAKETNIQLKSECASLQTKLNTTEFKLVGVKSENVSLESKLVDVESELTNVKSECASLQTKLNTTEFKLVGVKSENVSLESKLVDVESELTNVKSENVSLESKLVDVESELTNVKSENVSLESKLVDAESELTNVKSELTEVKRKVEEEEVNIDDMSNTLNVFYEKYEDKSNELDAINSKKGNLETSIKEIDIVAGHLDINAFEDKDVKGVLYGLIAKKEDHISEIKDCEENMDKIHVERIGIKNDIDNFKRDNFDKLMTAFNNLKA